MPVYARKIVALGQKNSPENIKDGFFLPTDEGPINTAVIAELFRQVVPLTTCPHPKDDAVKGKALIAALVPGLDRWVVDVEHFLNEPPKRVGNVPNGR